MPVERTYRRNEPDRRARSGARQGHRDRRLGAGLPGRHRPFTVEARVVVASIDTYLKYSEAVSQVPTLSQARRAPATTRTLLAENAALRARLEAQAPREARRTQQGPPEGAWPDCSNGVAVVTWRRLVVTRLSLTSSRKRSFCCSKPCSAATSPRMRRAHGANGSSSTAAPSRCCASRSRPRSPRLVGLAAAGVRDAAGRAPRNRSREPRQSVHRSAPRATGGRVRADARLAAALRAPAAIGGDVLLVPLFGERTDELPVGPAAGRAGRRQGRQRSALGGRVARARSSRACAASRRFRKPSAGCAQSRSTAPAHRQRRAATPSCLTDAEGR